MLAGICAMTWHCALASIGDLAPWRSEPITIEAVPPDIKGQLTSQELSRFDGTVRLFRSATSIGALSVYEFVSSATCVGNRCVVAIRVAPNEENPTARRTGIVLRGWKLIETLPMLSHADLLHASATIQFEDGETIFGVQFSYDGTLSVERFHRPAR